MLPSGSSLPAFTATDDRGRRVSAADYRGRWTVLWWYIKADTPG